MTIVINPKYQHLEVFIREIPQRFRQEGEIIYDKRNTLKTFEEMGISICVKSFHVPFFLNQIAYGFFRPSKAERSYSYGLKLQQKQINTPEPIAYIENKKGGLLQDSYYLCINQEHDGMMRELRKGPLEGREDFLRTFAQFAADMHEKGVLHKDFSPGNILYKKEKESYTFYLVDINRMIFTTVDMEKGCENLQRLWGSDEMIAFIAREYAGCRGYDANSCEKLALHYHEKFWTRHSKRHDGFLPYIGEEDTLS